MEVVDVAQAIVDKIKDLSYARKQFMSLAEDKANAISSYDKAVAIAIAKLRNGITLTIDGQGITDPPATSLGKLAHGYCWKERMDMEFATDKYRNAMKITEVLLAELNGWQSVNRHIESV